MGLLFLRPQLPTAGPNEQAERTGRRLCSTSSKLLLPHAHAVTDLQDYGRRRYLKLPLLMPTSLSALLSFVVPEVEVRPTLVLPHWLAHPASNLLRVNQTVKTVK